MSISRIHRYRRMRRARSHAAAFPIPLVALLLAPLVFLAMGLGAGGVIVGSSYVLDVTGQTPEPPDIIAARGGGAKIYDRNGVLLYEFVNDEQGYQQRVTLDEVSDWVETATIAAEDASFYSNPGINVRGLARASIENFRPGDSFLSGTGGSSITQQLVKQLYFTPEERQQRSVTRKIREAALALELTRKYSKGQILEWYLNEVPYGGTLTGVEAASEGYFGVPAKDLTLAQSAFLAGLPQSPATYNPFTSLPAAITRQHEVIDLMVKHGFISEELGAWAKLEQITLTPRPHPFLAPHFVQMVAEYLRRTVGDDALTRGGLEVRTTLDWNLQEKVNALLEQHLQAYENSTQGHNGSVVIMEPPTGQVLVMVGSRDYFRDDIDGEVNNALAINSPGSTLKPFTYATTFQMGWGPDWPVIDTPITYKEIDGKTFSPRNPDGRTRGRITVKEALGNSYNIPAFKAILAAGVDRVVANAKRMGVTTLDRDLGPAMTLGGVDVSLYDMVYGYSTFANNGVMAGTPTQAALPPGNRTLDPIIVLEATNTRGETIIDNTTPRFDYVLNPAYAYMVTDILSNDANRSVTYGRGSTLNIPGHRVAAKTGTSEPFEGKRLIGDTWTFGYTPDLAVGVWIGNSDNSPMVNIFSTTIAGRTWHDAFVAALGDRPARDWVVPAGIERATVCVPSGKRVTPGQRCQSVTGMFATEALDHNAHDDTWGGYTVENGRDPSRIPPEITGAARSVLEEYLRYRPAAIPTLPAREPAAPAPGAPGGAPGNGNGNGNGRGRGR